MSDFNSLKDLPQPEDTLTYQEFIAKIEIEKVYLRKMNLESIVTPEDISKSGEKVDIDLEPLFKLDNTSEPNLFTALGVVSLSAKIGDRTVFTIELEIVIQYDTRGIDKEIPVDIYENFVEKNVPVNLWPYVREIIQNATTRMGYPPLIVQPLRIIM